MRTEKGRNGMKCSLCGRLFGSESELQLHMEQEHEEGSAEDTSNP